MADDNYTDIPRKGGNDWQTPTAADKASLISAPSPIKHSELGIIALVLGTVAVLLYAGYIASFALYVPDQPPRSFVPSPFTGGWLFVAYLIVSLAAVPVGIVGVCLSNRKKLFAWLGLCVSLLPLLTCLGMVCFVLFLRLVARDR
jgi:hypothetical protein